MVHPPWSTPTVLDATGKGADLERLEGYEFVGRFPTGPGTGACAARTGVKRRGVIWLWLGHEVRRVRRDRRAA